MRWSWKLGEVSGIGIYMHATFLLLIAWVALASWMQAGDVPGTLMGVFFILTLFGCVVLHELGHAFAARKFGISTRDVTLLPIGGVARLERMPEDPKQEMWVALAGPFVNVVIVAVLLVWLLFTGGLGSLGNLSYMTMLEGDFLVRLVLVNIILVGFNLLPAFPMDGGRVVRALLAMRMEYTQATQIAATLGQSMALVFGFVGLLFNPFLLFIALFVWIGAGQEVSAVQMRSNLSGIPVRSAMITDFRSLRPDDTLSRAVELILTGSQQDFPVVDRGEVVGILTRSDLLVALAKQGQNSLVSDIMRRDFKTIDAFDMLEAASTRLQECGCHTMPVTHYGRLVGLLTMDNMGEFLMIQAALKKAKSAGLDDSLLRDNTRVA